MMLWIVIFSFFTKEKPTFFQISCSAIVSSGVILLGLDVSLGWSLEKSNIVGVVINLVSSICSAFSAIFTRNLSRRIAKGEAIKMGILEVFTKKGNY